MRVYQNERGGAYNEWRGEMDESTKKHHGRRRNTLLGFNDHGLVSFGNAQECRIKR